MGENFSPWREKEGSGMSVAEKEKREEPKDRVKVGPLPSMTKPNTDEFGAPMDAYLEGYEIRRKLWAGEVRRARKQEE